MVVADPRLEVVDLKSEVPERRSGGIRPNLTPGYTYTHTHRQTDRQIDDDVRICDDIRQT